ncbi:MAG: ABC transporter permease [Anaerolineales bacterium]|nr:ABC transporter permease [Anaerolineales bacterium]MCB8953620.1 ABC transporter permease [Ardenticatenales bacterium]
MAVSLKLEKRLQVSRQATYLVPVVSVVLALLFGALLLASAGANPWVTYKAMLAGAFGTPAQWRDGQFFSLVETLVKAIPIMLTGLSVAIAFRMRFWNIGAEGQLVMGGVGAAAVALWFPVLFPFLPESLWVYLPLMVLASILLGAIWALIPALLKAYLRVDEIITTLMLNYIAILFYQYLFNIAWKDPQGFGFPGTAMLPEYTWLPRISGRLHWGLVLAVVAGILVWFIMDRTRAGYEIRLIGENPNAARYAGVSLIYNIILVMLLSGGLAGLAGMSEVAGISHRLQRGLNVGNGFTGIIVAWLAKLHPMAVLLVGVLLAALFVGGEQIQISMGLPAAMSQVLQGAILLFVLGGDIFSRYRLRVVRASATGDAAVEG